MNRDYQYRERSVQPEPNKQFRFGEGRISGYSAVFLGAISLLAVLAYLFPSYLTTTELRQAYDAVFLQQILKYTMYFSLFLGILSLFLNKNKLFGIVGVALTLGAFALGGYTVPVGPVKPHPLSLGVDWLVLTFLGSVIIFTTLEKLFPKYNEQVILRGEWGLDLFYFCFNHLAISAICCLPTITPAILIGLSVRRCKAPCATFHCYCKSL
jgi:hypothetical protein